MGTPTKDRPPHYRTEKRGTERWFHRHEGERYTVLVHRLAAVAWFGFDAVAGNVVHHEIPIRWLNTEWNLDTMGHGEHTKHHKDELYGDEPWRDEATLRRLYVEQGMTLKECGDELGCSFRTVANWLERFGVERRGG